MSAILKKTPSSRKFLTEVRNKNQVEFYSALIIMHLDLAQLCWAAVNLNDLPDIIDLLDKFMARDLPNTKDLSIWISMLILISFLKNITFRLRRDCEESVDRLSDKYSYLLNEPVSPNIWRAMLWYQLILVISAIAAAVWIDVITSAILVGILETLRLMQAYLKFRKLPTLKISQVNLS
jgi:hypothetical protein